MSFDSQHFTQHPRTAASQKSARRLLAILAGGYGLVILSLLGVEYVSLQNTALIEQSAGNLATEQIATNQIIDRVQRQQVTLRLVVHRLIQDPESIDPAGIAALLLESQSDIDRIIEETAGEEAEPFWRQLQRATTAFADEARSALNQRQPPPQAASNLFRRQEDVMFAIRELILANHESAQRGQRQIREQSAHLRRQTMLLLIGSLILAVGAAVLTIRLAIQTLRALEWQTGELARVSGQLLEKQETTARRFSHELHDELGQTLAALKANIAAMKSGDESLEVKRHDSAHLTEQAISSVRELSQLLHPTILDHFGLSGGLRWLCEGFEERTGIQVSYQSKFEGMLPEQTRTHLFRIAQEALTNVARHSQAKEVEISLDQQDSNVRLTVRDNGRGLPENPSEAASGFGLVGIRARARLAGGEVAVHSQRGQGTRIEVWAPIGGPYEREKNKDSTGG